MKIKRLKLPRLLLWTFNKAGMKKPNYFISFFTFLLLVLTSISTLAQGGNLTIDATYAIAEGTTEEYNGLSVTNNGSLNVNGTLIVNGNISMGNQAEFTMGQNAVVIVRGDFEAGNKVNISVSSYLIIGGSFTKSGSAGKETISIENGNIYILGEVSGWESIEPCPAYDGLTESEQNDCQYGDESSLEENYEWLPPEISEKLNCFNVDTPEDIAACDGATVNFSVSEIEDVNYQWQFKSSASASFENIGTNSNILEVNVDSGMDGYQYRVKVKPQNTQSTCKISFSQPAVLTIPAGFTWTGNSDSNWNNSANWLCGILPDINSSVLIPATAIRTPTVFNGNFAAVKNIEIETNAFITLAGGTLEVAGNITGWGKIDATHGNLIFSGNSSQTIPSALLLNNTLESLEIDNSAGVIANSEIDIIKKLKVTQGVLKLNQALRLISNDTITALIDGSGNGSIDGAVTMQRYLDPAFGYKYFSSPFSNSIVGDFASYVDLTSTFPLFYTYDENRQDGDSNDLSGWTAYTSTHDALEHLSGYALNFGSGNSAKTIELTGMVNNGHFSRILENHDRTFTKGFNLVGNPYPSPIDWDKTGWTKTNIDDAIYFFHSSGEQFSGSYSSYVNGISSDGNTSSIIPSMQGFFVHVSDDPAGNYPVSASLGVTNSVRVTNFDQEFHKQQVSSKSLIRLAATINGDQKDQLVFYSGFNSSPAFDSELDALKLFNTNPAIPNFYSISGEQKISINSIDFNTENSAIPLGLQIQKDATVTFDISELENIDPSLNIYLKDKVTNQIKNLREAALEIHLNKGQYDHRFFLIISSERPENISLQTEAFRSFNSSDSYNIQMNLKKTDSGILSIANMNGQIIKRYEVSGMDSISLKGILSSGIYVATYSSKSTTFTKKIIIP